jgi:hypothetical protein
MRNYTDSDYALNKHSEGIVYRFADSIVEITMADFLSENPHLTAEDFLRLKQFSDADYLAEANREKHQTRRQVDMGEHMDNLICSQFSPEELLIDAPEREQKQNMRVAEALHILDCLTDTQRKRYLLHHVNGLTTREIADSEGVTHQMIVKSILGAEKKIKKILVTD